MNYPEPYGLECGDGWKDIIHRTHDKLKYIDPEYKISQIKEKFGGLRYYYNMSFDSYDDVRRQIMDDIVAAAELESFRTCELCGVSGLSKEVETRNLNRWYYTYCKECSDKKIAYRNESLSSAENRETTL
jgi:hypothetical protein